MSAGALSSGMAAHNVCAMSDVQQISFNLCSSMAAIALLGAMLLVRAWAARRRPPLK
jgi:hypothetical protein